MKTDITDRIHADLRKEAESRRARFYRLEAGTLMMRNAETLSSQFFLDEADALGVLRDGRPPRGRAS